jgi:hypothetical protein
MVVGYHVLGTLLTNAYVVYIKVNIAEGVDRKQLLSHYEFRKQIALNSSPAIMPLAALYFGVLFFGGTSPSKIGQIAPFFSHDTSSFKGTCLLINLKEAKVALYGPHLHCQPGQ